MIGQLFCHEEDAKADGLRDTLLDFYSATTTYDVFQEQNYKPDFWAPVVEAIQDKVTRTGRCVVLEFGAGCTGFAQYLGGLRRSVEFHVQDVTVLNEEHLRREADVVHLTDMLNVMGRFDVIFSTFVWEHITRPRSMLSHLVSILGRDGTLFIASPRYDFPGYISPSARHLPRLERAFVASWLVLRRIRTLVTGRPDFLLHCDPSICHGPWYRDADAVHWVSMWDLSRSLGVEWKMKRIRISSSGLPNWFWEKYLLLFVAIRRGSE